MGRRMRPAGIVLILVSGVVSLLLLVALALLQVARAQSAFSREARLRREAEAAALSGMEYAAARLAREDPYPRARTAPETRGEDWRFRDDPATEAWASANPSYAHGETWLEGGTSDGRFAQGDAPGPDADRNGRLSARSGRIRGGAGRLSFLLKIDSAGGRLPLNAGFLDALDRNANGVPDCRDLGFVSHAGLAHALNNLGEIRLPSGHPRRTEAATENPDEPMVYSSLGDDLLARRPVGGYRTVRQVEETLRSLGGGTWYPAAPGGAPRGLAEILPFLDLGAPPAQSVPQSGPPAAGPAGGTINTHALHAAAFAPASPVEMSTAFPEVLESLWRFLSSNVSPGGRGTSVSDLDPRTAGNLPFELEEVQVLHQDESRRLAIETVRYRRERLEAGLSLDWVGFYRRLQERAESMDTTLYDPGSPGDGKLFMCGLDPDPVGGHPDGHAAYAQMKADLAFQAVAEDPHPFPWMGPVAWASWGIDRMEWESGGFYPASLPPMLYATDLARIPVHTSWESVLTDGCWRYAVETVGLTLRPPVRFCVEAAGFGEGDARAVMEGSLTVAGAAFFSSQEDFENLEGGAEWGKIGLSAKGDPASGRRPWTDSFGTPGDPSDDRTSPSAMSLPRFPRGSYPSGPLPPAAGYYPRRLGALAPAPYEAGPCGADLYWAFGETDADTPAGFPSESTTGIAPLSWGWPSGWLDPSIGDPAAYNPSVWPYLLYDQIAPYHVTGRDFWLREGMRGDLPDGCPGLPAGAEVPYLAFEGWLSVGPMRAMAGLALDDGSSGDGIRIRALTAGIFPRVYRIELSVKMPGCVTPGVAPPHVDLQAESGDSGLRHVALVFERIVPPPPAPPDPPKAPFTRATLIVDGGGPLGLAVARHDFGAVLQGTADERLSVTGFDELRIHTRPFDPVAVFRKGRFVRAGTYVSPVYTFDGTADLGRAEWTGIVPSGWKAADGSSAEPISALLTAYDGPEGTGGSAILPLAGRGALADLSGLMGKRSFRYAVQFDATGVAEPGVLADAPVFESLWITFRRRGADPAWSSWRSR